jgi:hypothetical protein
LLFFAALSAQAAAPLFPRPLHLTRTQDDPLTGRSSTTEEYYFANRVVTVAGSRSVIVDYDAGKVTEVDRANATYSVTSFEEVASSRPPRRVQASSTAAASSMVRSGSDRRSGRNVDLFVVDDKADDKAAALHAEIAVDHSVALSKDAFDVVIGSAYPSDGGGPGELTRGAARRGGAVGGGIKSNAAGSGTAAATADSYGLPVEQIFQWTVGKQTVTAKNRVTRVGDELVPADLVVIPPGARLVESHVVATKRLADELDSRNPVSSH